MRPCGTAEAVPYPEPAAVYGNHENGLARARRRLFPNAPHTHCDMRTPLRLILDSNSANPPSPCIAGK